MHSTEGETTDQAAVAPRKDRSAIGMVTAGVALLLLVAFSPTFSNPYWAPRLVLASLLGALGLPLLPRLLRSPHRRGAMAGLAFIAVAVVAAVLAERPVLSFLSSYGGAGSVLLVASIVGAWAVGLVLDEPARRHLANALLVGIFVNVAVALLQGFVDLNPYRLGAPLGSEGLLGNPVHLGAVLAGGVALVASRAAERASWLAGVALLGVALPFSASRLGAVAALVVAVAVGVGAGRRGILLVAVLIVGFAAGEMLQRTAPATRAVGTTEKLSTTQGIQIEQRLDAWSAGVKAAASRPLGTGPGRFVTASSPRTTLRLARASPDTLYLDAHNVFVEYLGTMGVAGLLLFSAFLGLALGRARGQFLWFAVGLLIVYLMQPQSFATIPLLFLSLGAATQPRHANGVPAPAAALGTALVVGLAAVLFTGDFVLRQADLDFRPSDGRTAARLLFAWPESAAKLGTIHLFAGTTGGTAVAARQEENLDQAERWLREAAERDPAIPNHWSNLADVQLYRNDLAAARASFARALEANPLSVRALIGSAAVERKSGDRAGADRFLTLAGRVIAPDEAERLVRERAGA